MADTRELLTTWLNQKWRGQKLCFICGSNNWGISDKPVEIREFHAGGLVVGGPVYPAVMVICNVCGYTLLFNALVPGILPRNEPAKPAASSTPASPATRASPASPASPATPSVRPGEGAKP